jgi:hypothetical protein
MVETTATPTVGTHSGHEPFYDHRVPPYRCPACEDGVLLLRRDTLHLGETAESRAQEEAVGPEIGEGVWRFSCLFQCCDADCQEAVACVGRMWWSRDPRLSPNEEQIAWQPGMGQPMSSEDAMHRMQAELVHRYSPEHFLPPLRERSRASTKHDVKVADDYTWMIVGDVKYMFKLGRQANTIRVLHEAWEASGGVDGSGLSEEAIGKKIDSSAQRFRIDRAFEGNTALGAILRQIEKGQWALFISQESDASVPAPKESTTP